MPKKDRIEEEYEKFKAEIRVRAEEEIKKMEEKMEKVRENAEKVGEEIEGSINRKRLKARKPNKP